MRLINTSTYVLHDFTGPVEPYAILSHTWEPEGEVTFRDIQDLSVASQKAGWPKVEKTCEKAREMGIEWAWIDTCCIDKSSSAELTEAINSMFNWYRASRICFAYLPDILVGVYKDQSPIDDFHFMAFRNCRWFTRGWTLQELIAPDEIIFLDKLWIPRATKTKGTPFLSWISGIPQVVLRVHGAYLRESVAGRMSWAAHRITTRIEDMAYSLMGIFDVNLPLLYGEGGKAFLRLQEAIAQTTDDMSLFAWTTDEEQMWSTHGILAKSPGLFARCGKVAALWGPLHYDRLSFAVTNRGFEFRVPLKPCRESGDYLMPLFCVDRAVSSLSPPAPMLAVRLVKTLSGYVRHQAHLQHTFRWETPEDPAIERHMPVTDIGTPQSVCVPKFCRSWEVSTSPNRICDSLRLAIKTPEGVVHTLRAFGSCWDLATSSYLTGSDTGFTGLSHISFAVGDVIHDLTLTCGLAFPQNHNSPFPRPWVALHRPSADHRITLLGGDIKDRRLEVVPPREDVYLGGLGWLRDVMRNAPKGQTPATKALFLPSPTTQSAAVCVTVKVETKVQMGQENMSAVRLHECLVELKIEA